MKVLTVLYRHSNNPIEVQLEDSIADQLYVDIYTARIAGKTTLQINGSHVQRFIDPSEIIDCMISPVL
jgi:hypothetical protein